MSSATERLSQSQLVELLKKARIQNDAQGLTGMLLCRDGNYLQYLEGSRNDIDLLMNINERTEDAAQSLVDMFREMPLSA